METLLSGMHIAILVTNGFEQIELSKPKAALEQQGAITRIVAEKAGRVQGFHHDSKADFFKVDLTLDAADHADFDAVLLPGGVMNSDHIRTLPQAQRFVQGMQQAGKPIAVICHGAWLLVSAGLVKGRTLTSWPSLQDDIRNAGGKWQDQQVVIDRNWISSRKPDDIPAFNKAMVEQIGNYMKAALKGTADENAVGIASS
jgi:protease I